MAVDFPSKEWVEEYKNTLNSDAGTSWQEAAKTWEGDFIFVVEADEKLEKNLNFYMDLWHGECRNVEFYDTEDNLPEAEFHYKGTYSNWLKLINGEIDPIKGILMGKFQLKGNKAKVMRAIKAAQELVATAQKIETNFLH